MDRGELVGPAIFLAIVLPLGAVASVAAPTAPQVYQKMASEGVAVSSPPFVLVQGTGTIYVRSIRIQLVGIRSSEGWLSGRFACWFGGDPLVVIDSIQFNAGPEENGATMVESFDWPPDYYAKGLPAPAAGDAVMCGWEAPGIGQDPPTLVAGFARVRMLFKDTA